MIAAFDQNPHRSPDRRIAGLIDEGRVALVHNLSPDLSIDEVVQQLVQQIRHLQATRVVIDRCRASSWRSRRRAVRSSGQACCA